MQQPLKKLSKIRPYQIDLLTARERQIVRVMAEGLTNKEIAQRLKLAEGTVKVHLHRIYRSSGSPIEPRWPYGRTTKLFDAVLPKCWFPPGRGIQLRSCLTQAAHCALQCARRRRGKPALIGRNRSRSTGCTRA
jgi:hypothetical protein